jgi:hypothetical protein
MSPFLSRRLWKNLWKTSNRFTPKEKPQHLRGVTSKRKYEHRSGAMIFIRDGPLRYGVSCV